MREGGQKTNSGCVNEQVTQGTWSSVPMGRPRRLCEAPAPEVAHLNYRDWDAESLVLACTGCFQVYKLLAPLAYSMWANKPCGQKKPQAKPQSFWSTYRSAMHIKQGCEQQGAESLQCFLLWTSGLVLILRMVIPQSRTTASTPLPIQRENTSVIKLHMGWVLSAGA